MSMELLLPHPEVLLEIFYYLNGRDLYVCSAVCRTWKTLLDDERYPEASIWTMRLNKSSTPQFKASPFVAKLSGKEKLRVFENAWDNNAISENIYITDNQLTLHRRPIASSTDLARGKRGYLGGLHYWSVVWHGPQFGSNAIVGVATDKEKLHGEGYFSLLGNTSESWGWDLSKNLLRHNQETFGQYLSSDINIEVRWVLWNLAYYCTDLHGQSDGFETSINWNG